MSTSPVRIRTDDKSAIEALLQRVSDATGRRPTQHDIVHWLVEFALRREDEFLTDIAWQPLDGEQVEAWCRVAHDLGPWSIDDVDETVYGDST